MQPRSSSDDDSPVFGRRPEEDGTPLEEPLHTIPNVSSRVASAMSRRRHSDPTGGIGSRGSSAPSSHQKLSNAQRAALRPFRYVSYTWAWTALAVGNVEEASRSGEAHNDLLAFAAALAISGDAWRAILIIEAHIVGLCAVCDEVLSTRAGSAKKDDLARKHKMVIAGWLQTRTGPNPSLSDGEYREIVSVAVSFMDLRRLRRWYCIALVLYDQGDGEDVFQAAKNVWLRYIFALFPDGAPPAALSDGGGEHDGIPAGLEDLELEETLGIILSGMDAADVCCISAVTAYTTQRYRSAMVFATRQLELRGSSAPPQKRWSVQRERQLAIDAIGMRFIRCSSALEIGERAQAAADVVSLLQWASDCTGDVKDVHTAGAFMLGDAGLSNTCVPTPLGRRESLYVGYIGAALALYGIPLPNARKIVLAAIADTRYTASVRAHILAVSGYTHALTLLHVGELEASLAIAQKVAEMLPHTLLTERLHDVVVTCSVGLEDSTTILETPLSPYNLLYLTLCPAFFGSLLPNGIRFRKQTEAFRLLYPSGFSLYLSVQQVLPFHMNRAFYFFSHGNYRDAWDDVCCSVAAADEIVGSAQFAFTECFPLRVYFFGCQVALVLLEQLFREEVKAVGACLQASAGEAGDGRGSSSPDEKGSRADSEEDADRLETLLAEKNALYEENGALAKEVIAYCRQWTEQIQRFYPHSVLGHVARVRTAVMTREKDMLKQAVVLSRRYPHNTMAQNTLTLALYFSHNISEAVDTAQKNLQDFPHAYDVMEIHRWLHRKEMVYVFNYRTLVPLRYRPGDGTRFFTKRMLIAIVLLLFNTAIVLLTCLLNIPTYVPIPESSRKVAVRLQLPSMVPTFFAAVLIVHAMVAAATPKNLVHTFLLDNHFCSNALSRFLFSLRGMALVNVVNALQISLVGNNFLFDHAFYTFMLYFILTFLFAPFTTRMWFLPSVDEPKVGIFSWLTLLSVDTVIALVIVIPHIVLAGLEPFMAVLYYMVLPSSRPTGGNVSSSVRRRLIYHEQHQYLMPSRFSIDSGSRFIHIRLLSLLYWRSHSARETAMLDKMQLEAEGFRAFPLLPPESVGLAVETDADDGAFGRDATRPPRSVMPLHEPLFTETNPTVLAELSQAAHPRQSDEAASSGGAAPHDGGAESTGEGGHAVRATSAASRTWADTVALGNAEADDSMSDSWVNGVYVARRRGTVARRATHALTRSSSQRSASGREQFLPLAADTDRLVDVVRKTLGMTVGDGNVTPNAGARLGRKSVTYSFYVPGESFRSLRETGTVSATGLGVGGGGGTSVFGTQHGSHVPLPPGSRCPSAGAPARGYERRQRRSDVVFTLEDVPEVESAGGSLSDSASSDEGGAQESQGFDERPIPIARGGTRRVGPGGGASRLPTGAAAALSSTTPEPQMQPRAVNVSVPARRSDIRQVVVPPLSVEHVQRRRSVSDHFRSFMDLMGPVPRSDSVAPIPESLLLSALIGGSTSAGGQHEPPVPAHIDAEEEGQELVPPAGLGAPLVSPPARRFRRGDGRRVMNRQQLPLSPSDNESAEAWIWNSAATAQHARSPSRAPNSPSSIPRAAGRTTPESPAAFPSYDSVYHNHNTNAYFYGMDAMLAGGGGLFSQSTAGSGEANATEAASLPPHHDVNITQEPNTEEHLVTGDDDDTSADASFTIDSDQFQF